MDISKNSTNHAGTDSNTSGCAPLLANLSCSLSCAAIGGILSLIWRGSVTSVMRAEAAIICIATAPRCHRSGCIPWSSRKRPFDRLSCELVTIHSTPFPLFPIGGRLVVGCWLVGWLVVVLRAILRTVLCAVLHNPRNVPRHAT